MFRAARYVQRYASVSLIANTPYLMAVPTKQFVCPYLHVSKDQRPRVILTVVVLTWSLAAT